MKNNALGRIVVGSSLMLGVVALGIGQSHADETVTLIPPTTQSVPCQEDQSCWDCHTMGNHICGSDLQAQADAAWEGLSMEDQQFLNSIGASDETIIAYRDAQLGAVGMPGAWAIEVDLDDQEVVLVPVSPKAPHLGATLPVTE